MAKRPTISDLATASGVSVATVDRVLNGRLPVREETAERVLQAAETIGFHAATLLKHRIRNELPTRTLGFLLQKRDDAFYQKLASDLTQAAQDCSMARCRPVIEFVSDLSPVAIAEALLDLGTRAEAIAVVSVDHPHVSQAIGALKQRGVPTFAIVTDLAAEARAGYIGRDNRKEGRTAAWMITRTATRPGKVGIIIGSHRYVCQETAEISFRSYMREHATQFRALEPLVNLEDPGLARSATLDLVRHNRDLAGLYICGGGVDGVIQAARELDRRDIVFVCNELTPRTRLGLIDGILTAVISTPTVALSARTVDVMVRALADGAAASAVHIVVPFDLFISENI